MFPCNGLHVPLTVQLVRVFENGQEKSQPSKHTLFKNALTNGKNITINMI
jgi:hypothetical protein